MGLTLTLLIALLIPLDVYSVSSADLADHVLDQVGETVKVLYYVLYASIMAFVFGIIPFTYFYYEEFGEGVTVKQRIWAGFKYTIFLVLIVGIVFIIGLFVKGGSPKTDETYQDYASNVIDKENAGDSAITLAVACTVTVGFVFWCTYTAYGLSAFPLDWVKGKRSYEDETGEVEDRLARSRGRRREIASRYLGGNKMSHDDEAQINLLKREEEALADRRQRLQSSRKGWANVLRVLRPFKFILGFSFLIVTAVIIVALVITNIDKILNSPCGIKCGYVLDDPKKWNPLDMFFVILSPYFPLDYIFLGLLVAYIYFSTLGGVMHLSIRLLWMKLYKVRPGGTLPQGLLLACVITMFSMLALSVTLMSLSPQYVSFGQQSYTNADGDYVACDLAAPVDKCHMTQIATLVNRISLKLTIFGVIWYYAIWVFVGTFLLGLLVALFKRRPNNAEEVDSDDEWDF